jgi:hypothetical protein
VTDPETRGGVWALARFPALTVAVGWSIALAAAVVLAPSQPALGVIAAAVAIPCLGLALVVRPAVLAIALAFALMAVGRAELPPSDSQASGRAVAVAGQFATIGPHRRRQPRHRRWFGSPRRT